MSSAILAIAMQDSQRSSKIKYLYSGRSFTLHDSRSAFVARHEVMNAKGWEGEVCSKG